MKKLLGISLVAVLTAAPFMASAGTPVAGDPGATNADAPAATNAPKYSLVDANSTDDGKVATAGYVKGAYNAAIKAVNKVSETAASGITTAIQALDGSASQSAGNDGLALSVTTTDGVVTAVSGSIAAETYDAYGAAADAAAGVEAKLETDTPATNGYEINAKSLKVQGGDVATQSGVVSTINGLAATYTPAGGVSGTIPVMNNWDAQTGGDLSGATFSFEGTQAVIRPTVSGYQDVPAM